MTDTTATVDELLISLASGLAEAQAQLASWPLHDARGRPTPAYLLPELEFELRVTATIEQLAIPTLAGRTRLRVSPIQTSTTSEVTSTVRGRFVAVPPNGGQPMTALRAHVEPAALPHARHLVAVLRAGNQGVANRTLEFNLDLEGSRMLSALEGVEIDSLGTTRISPAQVASDAQGRAVALLELDAALLPGTHVVAMIEGAGGSESLVIVV